MASKKDLETHTQGLLESISQIAFNMPLENLTSDQLDAVSQIANNWVSDMIEYHRMKQRVNSRLASNI